MTKSEIRKQIRQKRAALSPEFRDQAARQVVSHFQASAPPKGSIAGYWATPRELDVRPLLEYLHGRGWRCFLPVVLHADQPLTFRLWHPNQALFPDHKGVLAPDAESPEGIPEVILTPTLAFDAQGFRLGQGGGYYDRTLRALRPPPFVIGIAFSVQRVPFVPRLEHDVRLDAVLTEQGWETFSPSYQNIQQEGDL